MTLTQMSRALMCKVERATVDADAVHFRLAPDHACDMTGAVETAETLCPGVALITTTCERAYVKERGIWGARATPNVTLAPTIP